MLGESPRVVGQCGRGRRPVVGGAAPVSELSSVEGAATGGTAGEAVLLWGANTVCRRGGGGAPRRGAAMKRILYVTMLARYTHHSFSITMFVSNGFLHNYCRCSGDDEAAHLALSSVLSSMGGSVLFEGCPDDDMDLV